MASEIQKLVSENGNEMYIMREDLLSFLQQGDFLRDDLFTWRK